MECVIQQKTYCADDNEYRNFCDISDKNAAEIYRNNHLKSQVSFNRFRKRQQVENSKTITSKN